MIMDEASILNLASTLALTLLMVSAFLSFLRLAIGPQAADRVVALDLICVLVIAILTTYATHTGDSRFLDVAIAYALIAFLGTVALSRFLMRGRRQENGQPSAKEGP